MSPLTVQWSKVLGAQIGFDLSGFYVASIRALNSYLNHWNCGIFAYRINERTIENLSLKKELLLSSGKIILVTIYN